MAEQIKASVVVQVTEEHIRDGVPQSVCNCPVALALKKDYLDVRVGATTIRIDGQQYAMDEKLKKFIRMFDNGSHVVPFHHRLILEAPRWFTRSV